MKGFFAFFKPAAARCITLIALGTLALSLLGACSPGHIGGTEIGFLRGGALWAIDPDSSNLHQIESGQFIGFSWSPNHQQIVLRAAINTPPGNAHLFGLGDLKSELGVTAIDGGNIIQITPPNSGLLRSDAWWDASGNRLLYREEAPGTTGSPGTPQWKLSQADQPAGIARKDLPASVVLPAVNRDGSLIATIDAEGRVLVGKPGSPAQALTAGTLTLLPGSNYPARPLWQPNSGALLYTTAGPTPADTTLMLQQSSGRALPLATISNVQQYAWSPNGQLLLVKTSSEYRVYTAQGAERFSWPTDSAASLPYWSPDSRFILILEPERATLINLTTQRASPLLTGDNAFDLPAAASPALAPFLRPATSSPWNASNDAFLLTTNGHGQWSGQPEKSLPVGTGSGDGLYLINLDEQSGAAQFPRLIDWGTHQSVAWTTLDPNCAFLLA